MNLKTTILFLFLTISLFSKSSTDTALINRVRKIEATYIQKDEISSELKNLNQKVDNQQNLNDKTFDSVSLQISSSSYSLAVFGILFGILAICLGVYVTYIERKIVKIREENKDLLSQNKKIQTEVIEVNRQIQSDINGLYLKIKREETIHILERLIKVPKDITNVCEALLSRDLIPEDFARLKQAYLKLKTKNVSDEGEEDHNMQYSAKYRLIFFQHFLNQVMKDDVLREDIKDFIPFGIQSAFENDIIKSTNDLIDAIVEIGLHNFKYEANKYFEGLSVSQHKNFGEVYQLMFDKLQNRRNRFEFYGLINKINTTRKSLINFGNLLVNNYSDNPTESEKSTLNEIEKLIQDEEVAQEQIRQQIEKQKQEDAERKAKLAERKRIIEETKKVNNA